MLVPEAKVGAPFTAAIWNSMRKAIKALRLQRGPGIHLRESSSGTIISADTFTIPALPFTVRQVSAASRYQIVPGWVNGSLIPYIGEEQLTADPAPTLIIEDLELDSEGRGYILLEVTCDDMWQPIPEQLQIIQAAAFDRLTVEPDPTPLDPENPEDAEAIYARYASHLPLLPGRKARWPLALLQRRKDESIALHQITQGDLQFRAAPLNLTSEKGRAFFF